MELFCVTAPLIDWQTAAAAAATATRARAGVSSIASLCKRVEANGPLATAVAVVVVAAAAAIVAALRPVSITRESMSYETFFLFLTLIASACKIV